jgi:hypothetical protein
LARALCIRGSCGQSQHQQSDSRLATFLLYRYPTRHLALLHSPVRAILSASNRRERPGADNRPAPSKSISG